MVLMWRGDRRGVLLSLAAAIAAAWTAIALLAVSGYFITATALAGVAGIGLALDVFRPSALIRFLAIARTATRYGERLAAHDATLRFLAPLRVQVFERLAARDPLASARRWRSAERLARMTTDVDVLDGLFIRFALPGLVSLMTLMGAGLLAAWLLGGTAASVVVLTVGAAMLVLVIAMRAIQRPANLAVRAGDAVRIRMIDLAAARLDLDALGRTVAQAGHLGHAIDRLDVNADNVNRIEQRSQAALAAIASIPLFGILLAGAVILSAGDANPALFVGLVLAALAAFEGIPALVTGVVHLGRAGLAARRLDIGDSTSHRYDNVRRCNDTDGAASPAPHPLVFRNVTLCYRDDRHPAICDVDMTIGEGERVAVVGTSGSGKSSLLALAARLWTPSAGTLCLGSELLEHWGDARLRQMVGYLPQRVDLFAGTLAENVTLGAIESSDTAIAAALAAAGLADLVSASPEGIHMRIGEAGRALSGGERRRVGLARLFLRRPQLWLLDEPTESLDAATAGVVLRSVERLAAHATILIACHHRREAEVANRIIVLAEGRVVDDVRRSDGPSFCRRLDTLRGDTA
jgi:ATP-binding cassette subfamily C protein CydC